MTPRFKVKKKDKVEYNERMYQPMGWEKACRFVAMRIPKEEETSAEVTQLNLFADSEYVYRIFITNMTWMPHKVISEYDKRADSSYFIFHILLQNLC